jgi:hypothetical protein
MFGQRTSDGRYAVVASLGRGWRRNPLAVCTSQDGLDFDGEWLTIHGDVPPQRYVNPRAFCGAKEGPLEGDNKDSGAQYVSRITDGNGAPPGGSLWMTYSVNKEDIWVAEVPAPIRGSVDEDVRDDFENMTPFGRVENWNIYAPAWCPVEVAAEVGNQFLRLQDRDPYDYAKAMRVFPASRKAVLAFKARHHQAGHGRLEIDVLDRRGERAVQLVIDSEAGRWQARAGTELKDAGAAPAGEWLDIGIELDAGAGLWSLILAGHTVMSRAALSAGVADVERIEFRTGEYRQEDFSRQPEPMITNVLSNADDPVPNAVFDIDDVTITRLT